MTGVGTEYGFRTWGSGFREEVGVPGVGLGLRSAFGLRSAGSGSGLALPVGVRVPLALWDLGLRSGTWVRAKELSPFSFSAKH